MRSQLIGLIIPNIVGDEIFSWQFIYPVIDGTCVKSHIDSWHLPAPIVFSTCKLELNEISLFFFLFIIVDEINRASSSSALSYHMLPNLCHQTSRTQSWPSSQKTYPHDKFWWRWVQTKPEGLQICSELLAGVIHSEWIRGGGEMCGGHGRRALREMAVGVCGVWWVECSCMVWGHCLVA